MNRASQFLCLSSSLFAAVVVAIVISTLAPSQASAENAQDSGNDAFDLSEIQAGSGTVALGTEGYRTGWVWVDPVTDLAADAVAAGNISNILYLNRCVGGCSIQPGPNDSRANTSTIAKMTSVLSEYKWTEQQWLDTVACVRDVYSPYDVQVVTEEPAAEVFHHESIVAGLPGDLGLAGNIGGIAPSSCQPLNNVISFTFANSPASNGGDPISVCWTIAQESAHSFGLPNHVYDCSDPMTYLPGCGKKFFRNQDMKCGEFQERPCNCSGLTQNSHVELSKVFDPGTEPPPPDLQILLPKAGETVVDDFTIFWSALDERLVAHTEIWINGTKYKDVPGKEFAKRNETYNTPSPKVPDGIINLELRSYNQLGSEAIKLVTVTKGVPCTSADTCFDFQECNEGRCEYGAAIAELGDGCDVDPQCKEGVCGDVGGSKVCALTCNASVTGSCADGLSCEPSATGGAVCVSQGSTGGCCSVAGSKGEPLPWLGIGLFLFGIAALRRRRYSQS